MTNLLSPLAPSADVVDRYLAGDATDADVRQVHAWLAAEPAWYEKLAALRTVRSRDAVPQWDVDGGWREVAAHIDRLAPDMATRDTAAPDVLPNRVRTVSRTAPPSGPTRPRVFSTRRLGTWAALALLLILLPAGAIQLLRTMRSAPASIVTTRDYATRAAQQATIALPDGSKLQLAPLSRARYTLDARGARVVELDGQGRFTVQHDPARTFTVKVGAVETRVLGTTFDVRRYPDDAAVQIAVVEGRVAAITPHGTLALAAGMVANATDSTPAALSASDVRAATAWTTGELVFSEAPVTSVLAAAERWSGFKFKLDDSTLARRRVTTALPIDEPATLVRVLEDLLNVSATVNGKVVTLHKWRTSRRADTPAVRTTPHGWSTPREVGR